MTFTDHGYYDDLRNRQDKKVAHYFDVWADGSIRSTCGALIVESALDDRFPIVKWDDSKAGRRYPDDVRPMPAWTEDTDVEWRNDRSPCITCGSMR